MSWDAVVAKNDITTWWPDLIRAGVPVPRTKILTTGCQLYELLDGKTPVEYDEWRIELRRQGANFGYPLFFRGGNGSGKHGWAKCCVATDGDDLMQKFIETLEDLALKDIMPLYGPSTWVLRELLPTTPAFYAFDGFPVTKERRYFVTSRLGGLNDYAREHDVKPSDMPRILGRQPYWPADSIEGHTDEPRWREMLALLNEETPGEVEELTALTLKVGEQVSGAWSVDWLSTANGWYAIDMATGASSYVDPECPTAPRKEDLRQI